MLIHYFTRAKQSRLLSPSPQFTIGGNGIQFVDKWPHLGHIISALRDNKVEILSKRNILCDQINNVFCYFGKRDPIIKLSLLKAYCSSFYSSILWDLSHQSKANTDTLCAIGVKDSNMSGTYCTTLTLPYCRCCVDCCR